MTMPKAYVYRAHGGSGGELPGPGSGERIGETAPDRADAVSDPRVVERGHARGKVVAEVIG